MDGHFVPNLTIGPPLVKAINRAASIPLDVHLMITNPMDYAEAYAAAGADVLTFHWEVAPSKEACLEVVSAFREHGVAQVGVAVSPDTPVEVLEPVLGSVDLALVMSVHPGFGGQSFIEGALEKTRWLRRVGYEGHVEMDGGLDPNTLPQCAAAGANAFVAGSAIFGPPDMAATIAALRAAAEAVLPAGSEA